MKTKEAIKYLDDLQDENFELQEEYNNKRILEVIKLLQRGEKCEKIVNDLKEFNDGEVLKVNENEWWKYRVNKIIQKYFPKSITKTITIELKGINKGLIVANYSIIKSYLENYKENTLSKSPIKFIIKEGD